MKAPVMLALSLLLPGALAAQELVVSPIRCGDAFKRIAEAEKNPGGEQVVASRLESILVRLATTEGRDNADGRLMRFLAATPEPLLVVLDNPANIEVIRAAVERMCAEDPDKPTKVRVQCTVLRMPANVAAAHGVGADRVLTKDAGALASMLRDTAKGGGDLHNLPEVVARPFVTFSTAPPAAKGDDERAGERARLHVRGEAVGLSADEFALDLQLVRELHAADAAATRTKNMLHRALRLKIGSSALVTGPTDAAGDVTVIWVRLFAGP